VIKFRGQMYYMDYVFYFADCETTGLDSRLNDVIELSTIRLNDGVQKTWAMKPLNFDTIEAAALRINGHKLEDLRGDTKFGRDTYLDPNKVLVDIENWIMEDGVPTERRVLVGQNVSFDREFLSQLWLKCNSKDSFPFGRRYLDTMVIEMFLDLCQDKMAEGYSLSNLAKKYGVKNEKAHSAAADTKTTKEVFDKQVEFFRAVLAKL
jgi:DNA polymerase III epsilon subunit-like protein